MRGTHIYGFEKLKVWQLSRMLVADVYKITNVFPNEEKFGICKTRFNVLQSQIPQPEPCPEGRQGF